MNTIYTNDKFRQAQNAIEDAERERHLAQLEFLDETLNDVVTALNEITAEDEEIRTMLVRSCVREAMQRAISTREATAQYKLQLLMPI